MKSFLVAMLTTMAAATGASAAIDPSAAGRLTAGAQIVREARVSLPRQLFDRSRCIVLIPAIRKVSFAKGEPAKGFLSCRAGDGWSAPAFVELVRSRWEVQTEAEDFDVLVFVVSEDGAQKLMGSSVALGTGASIVAGPSMREDDPADDRIAAVEMLAYSRVQSLFAGLNPAGSVLRPDAAVNREVYGSGASLRTILASRSLSAPTEATSFFQTLGTGVGQSAATPVAMSGATAAVRVPAAADSELRRQLLAMRQAIDRLLADQKAPSGADGRDDVGQRVVVSREQLEQLRRDVDALLAALHTR